MSRIVVFDSGFGSLSIIKAIRQTTKADIVYFADQKNFPYGDKSPAKLKRIILKTINGLKKEFEPALVVIGSNTPSILFPDIFTADPTLVGVLPPLCKAESLTKTNSIGIITTSVVIKNKQFDLYITKNIHKKLSITKINGDILINLVESAKFIYDKDYCTKQINSLLSEIIIRKNIDVITLSSTHLPFLLNLLENIFPTIQFLDPAQQIAKQILNHKSFTPSQKNSLKIFSSNDITLFQRHLLKLKIKNTVHFLEF